jgi:hypothetical protein
MSPLKFDGNILHGLSLQQETTWQIWLHKGGDITWYHLDAPDKIHNKKGK